MLREKLIVWRLTDRLISKRLTVLKLKSEKLLALSKKD